jgi:hypothetical protein
MGRIAVTYIISTTSSGRPKVSASARLWRIAGTVGPVILSRFRDLTLLFAGTLPDIAIALVNAVILPLLAKKSARRSK